MCSAGFTNSLNLIGCSTGRSAGLTVVFYRREQETIVAKMKHRSGTSSIASMARRNRSGELDGNARRCSKNLHGTA
jgi:hypothetical protein